MFMIAKMDMLVRTKTCSAATSSARNPTWIWVVLNLDLHGERLVAIHFSHGHTQYRLKSFQSWGNIVSSCISY
jgi:hypothetical protein